MARRHWPRAGLVALCCLFVSVLEVCAQSKTQIAPNEFAVIFNMGYAKDALPKDKSDFARLIQGLKEAHFNVVLGKYEDWRAEICKKHGMKFMVDLLARDHHVYRNVKGAQALCKKLRGDKTIYAYHLWSDNFQGTEKGRNRDIKNVHDWDPTHPTYVGSRNGRSLSALKSPNLIGYYDFHWKRGGHWRHLSRALAAARKTDAFFLRYCDAAPGRIGKGNYNRVLYTVSTSLAFGMKGYMFHYTGREIDLKTGQLAALGQDLSKVNAAIAPLGPELIEIGNPSAVYSTPITKTAKNRPTGQPKPIIPGGLQPIPTDFWLQVRKGETVIGVYRDRQKRDVLLLANHNAYVTQSMQLQFAKAVKSASLFDRKKGAWQVMPSDGAVVSFTIPPAAAELVRIVR